jgi:hypothetical protein
MNRASLRRVAHHSDQQRMDAVPEGLGRPAVTDGDLKRRRVVNAPAASYSLGGVTASMVLL